MQEPLEPNARWALVVENDEDWLDLLESLLRNFGYEVVRTKGIREALAAEHEASNTFDLAVIDVRLGVRQHPDRSGLALLERLVGEERARRYLVVTSHPNPDDRERAEQAGALYMGKGDLTADGFAEALAKLAMNGSTDAPASDGGDVGPFGQAFLELRDDLLFCDKGLLLA